MDHHVIWNGRAFVRRPGVWREGDFELRPGRCDQPLTAAQQAEMLRAMKMNPGVRAVLGDRLFRFTYWGGEAFEIFRPALRESFERAWYPHEYQGVCLWDRSTVLVSLETSDTVALLWHELFHSVYPGLPGDAYGVLLAHGDAFRELHKASGWSHGGYHNAEPEEAEAVQFQEWVRGFEPPYELVPSPDVVAVWTRMRDGGYAAEAREFSHLRQFLAGSPPALKARRYANGLRPAGEDEIKVRADIGIVHVAGDEDACRSPASAGLLCLGDQPHVVAWCHRCRKAVEVPLVGEFFDPITGQPVTGLGARLLARATDPISPEVRAAARRAGLIRSPLARLCDRLLAVRAPRLKSESHMVIA